MKLEKEPARSSLALRLLYIGTFVVMAFTGFGQMPIFKRYYIADLPGMTWTADYYLTHYIHYLGASLLLSLFVYFVLDFILTGRRNFRLTASAYIRSLLLGGIVTTGIFRVLKNLPDVVFSPNFTLFIDISHLGLTMAYLLAALFFFMLRWRWIERRVNNHP